MKSCRTEEPKRYWFQATLSNTNIGNICSNIRDRIENFNIKNRKAEKQKRRNATKKNSRRTKNLKSSKQKSRKA